MGFRKPYQKTAYNAYKFSKIPKNSQNFNVSGRKSAYKTAYKLKKTAYRFYLTLINSIYNLYY